MTDIKQLDKVSVSPVPRITRPLEILIKSDARTYSDEEFRVSEFQGEESVSQPFQFSVSLRANDLDLTDPKQVDDQVDLMCRQLLGAWATLRINLPETKDRFASTDTTPFAEQHTPSRFFHGVIAGAAMSAPGEYTLTLQSPLYKLSLRNNYTVHSYMSLEDLVCCLLNVETENYPVKLQFNLTGLTATRIQDWLQAGETDLAMLQRVLAKAFVSYYAVHNQDNLTIVFTNTPVKNGAVEIPGATASPLPLRYAYTDVSPLGQQQDDLLLQLQYQTKLLQQSVRSVLTRMHAQWEQNEVAKFDTHQQTRGDAPSPFTVHKTYSYGVNDTECEQHVIDLQNQMKAGEFSLSGTTTSALLSPGYTFSLSPALVKDEKSKFQPVEVRGQFADKVFVVNKIQHKMSDTQPYSGNLEAMEVELDGECSTTLLSPFNAEDTQQGSIVARVLDNELPDGWRFEAKKNFAVHKRNTTFNQESMTNKGCKVVFATASNKKETHWVRLSAQMQTVPDVGAMVLISRTTNESELPEISQVLASHGSKCIQPRDKRNKSWSSNTNWGSSYNTNYGDNISLRYGASSPVDLHSDRILAETVFDNKDLQGNYYKDSGFNRGGSYNFSVSDFDADGVLNTSVSAGCNYSENHALESYQYSDIQSSANYSQMKKALSVNVVGEYSGSVDFDNPSFVNGVFPECSEDLKGHFSDLSGMLAFAENMQEGESRNISYTKGRNIYLSGIGAIPPVFTPPSADFASYNNSIIDGDSHNINYQKGDSHNLNSTVGKSINLQGIGTEAPDYRDPTIYFDPKAYISYQNTLIQGNSYSRSRQEGATYSSSTTTGKTVSMQGVGGNTNRFKKPGEEYISYQDSHIHGTSYNFHTQDGGSRNSNYTKGSSINLQSIGTLTPPNTNTFSDMEASGYISYSDTLVNGNSYNRSTNDGNSYHESSTTGSTVSLQGIGCDAPEPGGTILDYVSYQKTEIDGNSHTEHSQSGNRFNWNTTEGFSENYTFTHSGDFTLHGNYGASTAINLSLAADLAVNIKGGIGLEINLLGGLFGSVTTSGGIGIKAEYAPALLYSTSAQDGAEVTGILAKLLPGIKVTA